MKRVDRLLSEIGEFHGNNKCTEIYNSALPEKKQHLRRVMIVAMKQAKHDWKMQMKKFQ